MKDNNAERFPIVDEEGRVIGVATRGDYHNASRLLHPKDIQLCKRKDIYTFNDMDKENKLILYKDDEGRISVNTRFADEDVWLK